MLRVNEIFGPTIQGEGKTAGKKVLFLRLALCNLHCEWCDTPYTWNWFGTGFTHPLKFDPKEEIHLIEDWDIFKRLYELGGREIRALVVSGGEPLIQWKNLRHILRILHANKWWVEIETNGTIAPDSEMDEYVDQYNCSPKLANSGNDEVLRVRSKALKALVANPKVYFKFVIASEQDIKEVLEYVLTYSMPPERVYLMPLGKTREELELTRNSTMELCNKYSFNFSDRLHVIQFGGVRGV